MKVLFTTLKATIDQSNNFNHDTIITTHKTWGADLRDSALTVEVGEGVPTDEDATAACLRADREAQVLDAQSARQENVLEHHEEEEPNDVQLRKEERQFVTCDTSKHFLAVHVEKAGHASVCTHVCPQLGFRVEHHSEEAEWRVIQVEAVTVGENFACTFTAEFRCEIRIILPILNRHL